MKSNGRLRILDLLLLAGLVFPNMALSADISGVISTEARLFPQASQQRDFYRGNLSLVAEPEIFLEWGGGNQALVVKPFVRIDQHDSRRSHFDFREFLWRYSAESWELRTGIGKVFWGVAESNHIVDIINQTDLVEDLDGEEKLGQAMIDLTLLRDWGTIDFFFLPAFRERRFPGDKGRPGLLFPFDKSPTFGAANGHSHVDFAIRWSSVVGPWDIGISHFYGTSRDPRFLLHFSEDWSTRFRPHYDVINQTGLDLQRTQGGWLWKLEWINRTGQGDRFMAAVGGFEYMFSNIHNSGIDLGILAEYNFDERGDDALTPLEDDLFAGIRLALNDIQSTEVLAGVVIDRESGASFVSVEASRRVGFQWTLDIEARSFLGVPPDDLFLYGIHDDDYVQASWSLHF